MEGFAKKMSQIGGVGLTFLLALFLSAPAVQAAPTKGYEALQVSLSGQGGKLTLAPGEEKKVSVIFQNNGQKSWMRDGANFVSIYSYDPKYRTSVFAHSSWEKTDQPVRISETEVLPGKSGTIVFTLKAPQTAGVYKETFHLAAEDVAWIPGGKFTFTITVQENKTTSTSTKTDKTDRTNKTNTEIKTTSSDGYTAAVLLKSAKKIKAKGGEVLTYTTGIKNTGTKIWQRRTVQMPGVALASSTSSYHHSSWLDSKTLLAKAGTPLAPGGLDLLSFQFRAPSSKGLHTVRFVLAADDVVVPGGEIDIPVEVTSDAPEVKDDPVREEVQDEIATASMIEEPILRVGVLIVDEETGWTVDISCESDFDVRDGNGNLMAEMKAGETVSGFYKNKKYWFNRGKGLEQTSYYLRFIPREENAVCTVTNFDRRVTRGAGYADNTFRNILELRYNEPNDRTWLINELSMEMYLRGLAETSNISHLNFQKALISAARTYALYHHERGTKHASEFFHVDAYADQVYKGYGQEQRTPRLTQSVQETEGVVVNYAGKTAITPYFSRSDGRTRSWKEVWYGDVAWLTSVPAPCDQGKTLWGHGVGMSASEALCMANQGKDWKDILTYFYTGVDLVKRWE